MSSRLCRYGAVIVLSYLFLSPTPANAFVRTRGETISDLGVPRNAGQIEPGIRVAYKYGYESYFWLECWTWGGKYCVYRPLDQKYRLISAAEAATLLGIQENELSVPFGYRFPLGWFVLSPLIVLGIFGAHQRYKQFKEEREQVLRTLGAHRIATAPELPSVSVVTSASVETATEELHPQDSSPEPHEQQPHELGGVLLKISSAAEHAHGDFLTALGALALVGILGSIAVVVALARASFEPTPWIICTGIAAAVLGVMGVLGYIQVSGASLSLHEHGVCRNSLFGVHSLRYQDLASVVITPLVITRSVNFIPIESSNVLEFRFVPREDLGLEPIAYFGKADRLDEIMRIARTWKISTTS